MLTHFFGSLISKNCGGSDVALCVEAGWCGVGTGVCRTRSLMLLIREVRVLPRRIGALSQAMREGICRRQIFHCLVKAFLLWLGLLCFSFRCLAMAFQTLTEITSMVRRCCRNIGLRLMPGVWKAPRCKKTLTWETGIKKSLKVVGMPLARMPNMFAIVLIMI